MKQNKSDSDHLKWRGVFTGVISACVGSALFSFLVHIVSMFQFEEIFDFKGYALVFLLGIGLSFLPAMIGGYLLAYWIQQDHINDKRKL